MQAYQSRKLLEEANAMMMAAREEMNRSKEDVVPHKICSNTRMAIGAYLKAYLVQNNQLKHDTSDLDVLYEACVKTDKRFESLDLTSINCRFDMEGQGYCSNVNKLLQCLTIAEQTKALITFETWPKSVHVK